MADRRRQRLLSPVLAVALAGSMALSGAAAAQPVPSFPDPGIAVPAALRSAGTSPRNACLEAAREAERKHGLPEGLLVGIALNESGLHAYALSIGGRAFYPDNRAEAVRLLRASGGRAMAGCVQINSGVHARGGQDWPLDPWHATDWAATYLRQHFDTYGDWGMAVVRWHGGTPRMTTRLVCRVRSKIDVVAPDSEIFRERCGRNAGAEMARFRRNGQALLELAEAPN